MGWHIVTKTTDEDRQEAGAWLSILYCTNPRCEKYQKAGGDHLKFVRRYGKEPTMLLYRCAECDKRFSLRNQTPLFETRVSDEKFYTIVKCVGEGNGIRGTSRICSVKTCVVTRIVERVGAHVKRMFEHFLRGLWPNEVQLDELWSFLRKKEKKLTEIERLRAELGDCWVWVAYDPESKVVLGYVLGKRTKEHAVRLLERVRNVLGDGCFPLFTSDELKCYEDAVLEVFGVKYQPERNGRVGRMPKARTIPHPKLKYAVVHKTRKNNRVVKVEKRVVFGSQQEIGGAIAASNVSSTINTFGVERNNGKMRAGQGRLARKSLCFSKDKRMMSASLSVYFGYDHFCRNNLGLREKIPGALPGGARRWVRRTPMMAIGAADHCWSVKELALFRVPERACERPFGAM